MAGAAGKSRRDVWRAAESPYGRRVRDRLTDRDVEGGGGCWPIEMSGCVCCWPVERPLEILGVDGANASLALRPSFGSQDGPANGRIRSRRRVSGPLKIATRLPG